MRVNKKDLVIDKAACDLDFNHKEKDTSFSSELITSKTINELIERKSVRVYSNKSISKKDKDLIIKASVNAPSAGNMQLYSIIDVTDQKIKNRLSVLCDNQDFIKDAKMVLIYLADYSKWINAFKDLKIKLRKPSMGDFLLACEDSIIAAENAVCAAHSLGIGSCYIGDIMENYEDIVKLFNLPKYTYPSCMVVFGYPDTKHLGKKPERFDNKYVVFENKYKILNSSDLKKMFNKRTLSKGYKEWMKWFAGWKFNSDFSKEMSRSAKLYVKDFNN